MDTETLMGALYEAKLLDAAKMFSMDMDKLSMLVAVATGKVAHYLELEALARRLEDIL